MTDAQKQLIEAAEEVCGWYETPPDTTIPEHAYINLKSALEAVKKESGE